MIARFARSLALMLLAWQAVVAPAHVHAAAAAPVAVASGATVSTPAPHRPDGPLDCPVCREIAHAGAYLTPGGFAWTPPAPVAEWRPVASLPALDLAARSPAWRSRAPPTLHA